MAEEKIIEKIKRADARTKAMDDFTSPSVLYEELISSVKKYHPSTDLTVIQKAYESAYNAHEGQKRKSGEPYIIPCVWQSSSRIWNWIRRRSWPGCSTTRWRTPG